MLRLQSFPASWKVRGSRREPAMQVGNATSALLAQILGRSIASHPGYRNYAHPPTPSIRRRMVVPPPEPITAVGKHYSKLNGAHPDHPGPGKGPGSLNRHDDKRSCTV